MKMEHLSIWDQRNRKFIRRGFFAGKITSEFDRTKQIKIADHTLAEINFESKKDLNEDRNEVINRDIKKLTTSGFRYESIGNVFLPSGEELEKNADGDFEILSHGTPIPGELEGGRENCAVEKLACADGANTDCAPGKCIIGKLKQISKFKWKYTSAALYNGVAAEYYVGGKEVIELKTIVRGTHTNPDGTEIGIGSPASKSTTIYLPPKNYLESAFSEEFLKFFNYTLDLDNTNTTTGVITTEEDFIRKVIKIAYRKTPHLETGPMYSSLADTALTQEVYSAVEDILFRLKKVWRDKVSSIMTLRWENRFAKHETNREFISYVLRELRVLFSKCLQVTASGIKQSRIRSISDENVRPIYFRLPSAALNYRPDEGEDILVIGEETERFDISISALEIGTIVALTDRSIAYQFLPRVITDEDERRSLGMSPVLSDRTKAELYSPRDENSWGRVPDDRLPKAPVAKWILAGADEFLREKKYDIESFYYTYLDPTECSPKNLDWLAQHVGLSGEVWNLNWNADHKRALIKNALGWFETSMTQNVANKEYKTIKGEVLDLHPFTSAPWRDTEEIKNDSEVDVSEVDLSKISTISINNLFSSVALSGSTYQDFSSKNVDSFSVYKEDWDGLLPSKGSLLTLIFLFSLFGVKAHTAEELDISNVKLKDNNKISAILRPKSGLRSLEINAPILLPTKYSVTQVGTEDDYSVGAYNNQLVADRTSVTSIEESKNVFFRLPYYYNRDGRTWDLVKSIAEYWTSGTLNARVQYAYLSADLWKIGDAFFEPEIQTDEAPEEPYILLENGVDYLITESGNPILY